MGPRIPKVRFTALTARPDAIRGAAAEPVRPAISPHTAFLAARFGGQTPRLGQSIVARAEPATSAHLPGLCVPFTRTERLRAHLLHDDTHVAAVFEAHRYVPTDEPVLRQLGVAIIRLVGTATDLPLTPPDAGWVLKPRGVAWVRRVEAEAAALRNLPDGAEPTRLAAWLTASVAWTLRRTPTGDGEALRLHDADGHVCAQAVLILDAAHGTATLRELTIVDGCDVDTTMTRLIYTVMAIAHQDKCHQVCLATEDNQYCGAAGRVHLERLALLGFKPRPTPAWELVKILNPAALGTWCFVQPTTSGRNDLHCYGPDAERPKILPRGIGIETRPFPTVASATPAALEASAAALLAGLFATAHDPQSPAQLRDAVAAARLFPEVDSRSLLRRLDTATRPHDRLDVLLDCLAALHASPGAHDRWLHDLARSGCMAFATLPNLSALDTRHAADPLYSAYLAELWGPRLSAPAWHTLLRELLPLIDSDLQPLAVAHAHDAQMMLRDLFLAVRAAGGMDRERALQAWILHVLNLPFPPARAPDTIMLLLLQRPDYQDPTVATLPLPTDGIAPAAQTRIRDLLATFARHLLVTHGTFVRRFHLLHAARVRQVSTFGGMVTNICEQLLQEPQEDRAWWLTTNRWGDDLVESATMRDVIQELYALVRPPAPAPESATRRQFRTVLARHAPTKGKIQRALFAAGFSPRDLPCRGHTIEDVWGELYDRLPLRDRQRLNDIVVEPADPSHHNRLATTLRYNTDAAPARPVARGRFPLRRIRYTHAVFQRHVALFTAMLRGLPAPLLVQAYRHLVTSYSPFDVRPLADLDPDHLAYDLAMQLACASQGEDYSRREPTRIGDTEVLRDARTWSRNHGHIVPLCQWYALHPARAIDDHDAARILAHIGADRRATSLAELLVLFRCLEDRVHQRIARDAVDRLGTTIDLRFLPHPSLSDERFVTHYLRGWNPTAPDRRAIERALLGIVTARAATTESTHDTTTLLHCALHCCGTLGLPLDPWWPHLDRVATRDSAAAWEVVAWLLRTRGATLPAEAQQRLFTHCIATLRAADPQLVRQAFQTLEYDYIRGAIDAAPLAADWPTTLPDGPLAAYTQLLVLRYEHRRLTPDAASAHVVWITERTTGIDDHDAAILPLLAALPATAQATVMAALHRRACAYAVASPTAFDACRRAIAQHDDTGSSHFDAIAILRAHPWATYAYSSDTCARIAALAADPYLTPRHAETLVGLLLSHPERAVNRHWVAQLLMHAPNLRELQPLLRFWTSLPRTVQNDYLAARFAELLTEQRARTTAFVFGRAFEDLDRRVAQYIADGRSAPEDLQDRHARWQQYRFLLIRLAEARSATEEARVQQELEAALLRDFPFRVHTADELPRLIAWLEPHALERLALTPALQQRWLTHVAAHPAVWRESGVFDRLIQFACFADADGLRMAHHLIAAYTDPAQAEVVAHARPDLGPQRTTTHLWYRAKFRALPMLLMARGLDFERAQAVARAWESLWQFHAVPGARDTWVTLTHDLERWAKHGEEPRLGCSIWWAAVPDMHPENWNHRHGRNPNASGRPLARPLTPQLALAELRVKGRIVNRRVVELTLVADADDAYSLEFLVERAHPEFELQVAQEAQFTQGLDTLLRRIADAAGLPVRVRIAEAEHDEAQQQFPTADVLSAPYPFIRDTFRPR